MKGEKHCTGDKRRKTYLVALRKHSTVRFTVAWTFQRHGEEKDVCWKIRRRRRRRRRDEETKEWRRESGVTEGEGAMRAVALGRTRTTTHNSPTFLAVAYYSHRCFVVLGSCSQLPCDFMKISPGHMEISTGTTEYFIWRQPWNTFQGSIYAPFKDIPKYIISNPHLPNSVSTSIDVKTSWQPLMWRPAIRQALNPSFSTGKSPIRTSIALYPSMLPASNNMGISNI